MSITVTCHYGGYTVALRTDPGKRRAAIVIVQALKVLFEESLVETKAHDVHALMVRNEIYATNDEVTLKDADVVVLLLKDPVVTPVSPQNDESTASHVYETNPLADDESRTSRVYETNLLAEEINLVTEETKSVELLREKTIKVSKKNFADLARLFPFPELLPSLLIVDEDMANDDAKKDYALLRKSCKMLLKNQKFFRMKRVEFFWHSHLIMPLLNKFSLHGLMSGETKLSARYSSLSLHPATRSLYLAGIFPDLCDGWLFKIAENSKGEYLLQTPFGETIQQSDIPSVADCGDGNILLLDFFVEIKPKGQTHTDRPKLHLQMGQAARLFAGAIQIYPEIFGLTCDGEIINGYAARAHRTGTSVASEYKSIEKKGSSNKNRRRSQGPVETSTKKKQSSSKMFQLTTDEAASNPDKPREPRSGIGSSSSRARSKTVGSSSSHKTVGSSSSHKTVGSSSSHKTVGSSSSHKTVGSSSSQSNSKEKLVVPPVSINHLWMLNLNDPTHSVLLAGYLARIRELRLKQFKEWRESVNNLPFKKPEQKEAQAIDNAKEDEEPDGNESSSKSSESDDEDKGDNNNNISSVRAQIVTILGGYGFMPHGYNLSFGKTFVYRGHMIADGTPAVFKGFDDLDEFEAELLVYEHFMRYHFRHMPKMLKYQCNDDLNFIITEDLGDEKLNLETKEDIKIFAFDLLTAVESLHDFRVIHSDLKLSNLCYLKDKHMVKFFDFSFSSILNFKQPSAECLGYTHGYASPEALSTNEITPAHDMFSVGMILASLVFNFKPKNDDDYKWVCNKIASNEPVLLADQPMLELIGQLLKSDHTERLSAKKALEAPVFTEESISSGDEAMHVD